MPRLNIGDPAPNFSLLTAAGDYLRMDLRAGRTLLLFFIPGAAEPRVRQVLERLAARLLSLSPAEAQFYVDTRTAEDRADPLLSAPPFTGRVLFDDEGRVHRLYEAGVPALFVLDRMMAVDRMLGLGELAPFLDAVETILADLPAPPHFAAPGHAPILVVPGVFEPAFRLKLLRYYEALGSVDSGYMYEKDGQTLPRIDYGHKRRLDCNIEDEALKSEIRDRLARRLVPWIAKSYQFQVTRMERYLIACYDGETGGHFNAHRDNTTRGTAHRRFATSINLNADFEGGELTFPEFGPALYKPEPGAALVFSCSLMHRAMPVRRGRRFVYLPFFYDEAAAQIRDRNLATFGAKPAPPAAAQAEAAGD